MTDDGPRVLVVEDEPQLARALAINLLARHYTVDVAADGRAALELAARKHPQAVILDLGLPDLDGLDVINGLRGWTRVPIMVLSARQSSAEKVAALDAGADDYVTKPFGMDELLARLRAAVRRGQPGTLDQNGAIILTEAFEIDLAAKRVIREYRHPPHPNRMAPARNPGQLSRQTDRPKTTPTRGMGRQLQPRNQLPPRLPRPTPPQTGTRPDPAHPRHLITEPGLGYRFDP